MAKSSGRAALFVLLAATLAACLAAPALGDADPASDVLYTGTVFYSYDQLPSDAAQERLNDAVAAATKAGHPIRVALIAKSLILAASRRCGGSRTSTRTSSGSS